MYVSLQDLFENTEIASWYIILVALLPSNPDPPIWHQLYNEEYTGLRALDVYNEITWEDYKKI